MDGQKSKERSRSREEERSKSRDNKKSRNERESKSKDRERNRSSAERSRDTRKMKSHRHRSRSHGRSRREHSPLGDSRIGCAKHILPEDRGQGPYRGVDRRRGIERPRPLSYSPLRYKRSCSRADRSPEQVACGHSRDASPVFFSPTCQQGHGEGQGGHGFCKMRYNTGYVWVLAGGRPDEQMSSMADKRRYSPHSRSQVLPSPAIMSQIPPAADHPTNGDPSPTLNLAEERPPLPAAAPLMAPPKPRSFRPLIEWRSVAEAQHEEREAAAASNQATQGRWKPLSAVSPHMDNIRYQTFEHLPDCVGATCRLMVAGAAGM